MRIAIVGSSGYIAQYILRRLSKVSEIESILKIGRNESDDAYLDLSKAEEFDYELLNDIDIIIFTAAISSPDLCAKEFEWCWKINVDGTICFIKEALNHECRVLFFSSDAVFGYDCRVAFDENSLTKAYTPYGKMKKAVEDTFYDEKNFKAIRLSYVASTKDKFIAYCIRCMRTGETANIFHPFYRNVIVISLVVDVVLYFILNWYEYEYRFLNVAGPELVSRVRLADELNRLLGDKLKYTISTPDDSFFLNRPKITQMKSIYLHHIIKNYSFIESMKKELEEFEL
jgi:dTDP-4-dehydrorhamnose reductase